MKRKILVISLLLSVCLAGYGSSDTSVTESPSVESIVKPTKLAPSSAMTLFSEELDIDAASGDEEAGSLSLARENSFILTSGEEVSPNEEDVSMQQGCEHSWVACSEEISHEATSRIIDSYLEPSIKQHEISGWMCTRCGVLFPGKDIDTTAHADMLCAVESSSWSWFDYYDYREPSKNGHNIINDSSAYSETVITGYKCSKCGATLPVD